MLIIRVDKINYYLNIAQTVAQRGTCLKRNYGSVIIKNDELIASGFSGSPRGLPNCIDLGCCNRELHGEGSGSYTFCKSVHSEMNSIISASRKDMIGSTLYLVGIDYITKELHPTAEPCNICKKLIINAGIEKVIIRRTPTEYEVQYVKDWDLQALKFQH